MKNGNPIAELAYVFRGLYQVAPPLKTRGRPSVAVLEVGGGQPVLTFKLKRLVRGQTFLGLYPTAANLPNADNLNVGDYALLGSGEVIQIGED